MTIHFIDPEPASEEVFVELLAGHDLKFEESLADVPDDIELLSISFSSRVEAAFLKAHPNLRFIATRCSGYDHIDLAACREHGVTVSAVPSYGENTVAEHTFALMLALSRQIRAMACSKREDRFSFNEIRGFDLHGKMLGVIGAGRIGLHVIRLARAFGMDVLACDIKPSDLMAALLGFSYAPLDDVLRRSHILTLHVPLTVSTVHLLNREAFAKCRRGVLVINTARGGVINTEALLEALDCGLVGGAGLDVLEDERVFRKEASCVITDQIVKVLQTSTSPTELHQRNPQRLEEIRRLGHNEALLTRSDVVFTPHTASNSVESAERIIKVTVENIRTFLAGSPVNVITE
jgi:D-lactate dehydrogenase